MGEWQPIETAPQDGTAIVVFDPNYGDDGVIQIAHCHRGEWAVTDEQCGGTYFGQPTHWLALPAPPQMSKIVSHSARRDDTQSALHLADDTQRSLPTPDEQRASLEQGS